MAWVNGIVISGGELQGQTIGINGNTVYNVSTLINNNIDYGYQEQINDATNEYYNYDFDDMIDVSGKFNLANEFANECLCDISILNDNHEKVGYFSLYVTKSGMQITVNGKIKDRGGVVVADFRGSGGITLDSRAQPKMYLCFAEKEIQGKKYLALYLNGSYYWIYNGRYYCQKCYAGAFCDEGYFSVAGINGHIDDQVKKKSPEFGPASEPGGYGPGSGGSGGSGGPAPTFDDTSDSWTPTPTKPGVLSYGLLNIYKADTGALLNLGRELFPSMPTFPSPVDPGQADLATYLKYAADIARWLTYSVNALAESIWNKDLINFIVSCHLVPIDVTRGALEDIEVGARTLTGILAGRVTNDVVEFDCGTVHIDEFYTNYVDYMTSCRLYLPYYGMVTIKPEYWQSADISVKYLWNILDGSFTAQVFSTITRHQSPCTTLIGQYSGSACIHMPLSGTNYATMFATLAGAAGGIATGVATGNVKVAATSAMGLAGGIGSAGDMQMSNAYNATSSFYSHSRPFLIIERPISHFSENYTQEKGIPLYVTKKLSTCSGFTVVEDPILNFTCPDDEAEAIRHALKTGVIL